MFDRFAVVDWSANSTPKRGRDSIWIAVAERTGIDGLRRTTRVEPDYDAVLAQLG